MTVSIFLGALLGPMALGVPIAFALIISGVALMMYLGIFDAQIIAQNVHQRCGQLSADGRAVLPARWRGDEHRRPFQAHCQSCHGAGRTCSGGLGFVAIFAACVLSSLSGSAVADAAALGALLFPMMRKSGHDPARAGGLLASAQSSARSFRRRSASSSTVSSVASPSPSFSSPGSCRGC